MSKRTSGPWRVSECGYLGHVNGAGTMLREAEKMLNTHAELLAALKQAMVILEARNAECTQDTAFIQNCRAALAKAEKGE